MIGVGFFHKVFARACEWKKVDAADRIRTGNFLVNSQGPFQFGHSGIDDGTEGIRTLIPGLTTPCSTIELPTPVRRAQQDSNLRFPRPKRGTLIRYVMRP